MSGLLFKPWAVEAVWYWRQTPGQPQEENIGRFNIAVLPFMTPSSLKILLLQLNLLKSPYQYAYGTVEVAN